MKPSIFSVLACLLILVNASCRAQDIPANALVAPGAQLTKIATGFAFTEGPACDSHGNVYFTDQPNNRIEKWDTHGKITTWMQPCGHSNGLCFDSQGNLWDCADENNQLWEISPKQKVTIAVTQYDGKLLNGPNDVWVRPTGGGVYFTDPFYPRDYWKRGPMEQDVQGVYYLAPDHKTLTRVVSDMKTPNGIIGTPDGKTLYVSDLGRGQTFAYDINPDGSLTNKRLFCHLGSDGMTIDSAGDVYCCGSGVTVFDKNGTQILHIPINEPWTGNICFGGTDRRTLFITSSTCVYTLKMQVHGVGSQ